MEDTLGATLLNKRDCAQQGFLGTFDVLLLNGRSHFFDKGFHRAFDVEVSKPPLLILPSSFNCR